MGRPLRIEYEGAVHHVTARGNRRGPIFLDDLDRDRFLALVGDIVDSARWRWHSYCLMGNHYHLVIETPDANLAAGMCRLNSIYAREFNRAHGRTGHLFGERYHTVLVEKDVHLLEVARYVVLNPVRAGLCTHPANWPWSSFRATMGLDQPAQGLDTTWMLEQFGPQPAHARARFLDFVSAGLEHNPFKSSLSRRLVGSEVFVARLRTPSRKPARAAAA
jgi:putative transposase